MSLTIAELERMSEIEIDILINTYSRDAGAGHIYAYMCNYIRALGVAAHRTLVKVVNEQLEVEKLSKSAKSTMTICYSRSTYVLVIDTPNARHVTPSNEVEIQDTKDRYMQRVFATDNLYGTGKPNFEIVMLQAWTTCRNGIKYKKIWFCKALGFLIIKRNA